MATLPFSLLPLLILFISQLSFSLSQFLLPITKHTPTNQYLTQIYHQSSSSQTQQQQQQQPTKVVVDLSGSSLWLDCSSLSSTPNPTPLPCRSIQCSSAKSLPCSSHSLCTLPLHNPISKSTHTGHLVESIIITAVDHDDDDDDDDDQSFLFSCAPSILLKGLPTGVKGVLGLGSTRIGAPTQFSLSSGLPAKFSLCLSSSNGVILPNLGEMNDDSISKSLIYTPLLGDYFINLKSIKIQNKKLSLSLGDELPPLMKLSSVSPYSVVDTRIYKPFVREFVIAAESLNMTRAQPVGLFELCYHYGVAANLERVPLIELGLQSEMVKWRIYGHNSMVKVSEDVICLGFLDGGLNSSSNLEGASIVLGGHQLEDNLLEFDLGSYMLGFSGSLMAATKQTSCSELSDSVLLLHKDHHPSL